MVILLGPNCNRFAFDHLDRLSAEGTSQMKLIHTGRCPGTGYDEYGRVVPRDHGHGHRFSSLLVFHVMLSPMCVGWGSPAQTALFKCGHPIDTRVEEAWQQVQERGVEQEREWAQTTAQFE